MYDNDVLVLFSLLVIQATWPLSITVVSIRLHYLYLNRYSLFAPEAILLPHWLGDLREGSVT